MTGRSVPEWIGSTPDAKVPPRVRIRVFEREGGRCHRCRRKISAADKWSIEHLIALANGGQHREGNMGISCEWCKPEKDREDVAVKSKTARIRAKQLGLRPPSRWPSRPMGKGYRQHTATSPITKRVGQFGGDDA